MTKHALLSPSSAYRWRRCPASAAIAAANPDPGNEFADEGTAAHELAAWCLTDDRDTAAYLGRVIEVPARSGGQPRKFTVDEEMAGYVQGYVERTRRWLDFAGAVMFVEQSLSITSTTGEDDARGTSDSVIVIPGAQADGYDLVIRDLKYGRGVPVAALDNDQLIIYAAGALEQFAPVFDFRDDAQVHMEIDQPRRGHVDRFTLSVVQLRKRIEEIRHDAKVALAAGADGPRAAGDHCRFCPIKATCETRAAWIAGSISEDAGIEGFEALATVSPAERLAGHLARVQAIRDWCASVEQEAHAWLIRGDKLPGWKLVAGRAGDRAWSDEQTAEATLVNNGVPRDHLFTQPKLKSVAQIEKLLPKDARGVLAPLITRSEGKPTIAPESDPRPPLVSTGTSADGFTAVDETASIL